MTARTRIKVCGITEFKDAETAVSYGADALGFIFVERSPRYIDPEKAREIIKKLPPFINTVGVFVDEEVVLLEEIAAFCKLSVLQLHGSESPSYCSEVSKPVVKAYQVGTEAVKGVLDDYADVVHGFLLDTFHNDLAGGTGMTFDWSLINKIEPPGPIILAGGLNPENVGAAVKEVNPYAVDVNSGVEDAPGSKDMNKLQKFFQEVRKADALMNKSLI